MFTQVKDMFSVYNHDISFLVPFDHGFVREVVIRKFSTSLETCQMDIYYKKGKEKLRSIPEVEDHLTKHPSKTLKPSHFCYSR